MNIVRKRKKVIEVIWKKKQLEKSQLTDDPCEWCVREECLDCPCKIQHQQHFTVADLWEAGNDY